MSSDIIRRIESSSWQDLEQIVKRNEIGINIPWTVRRFGYTMPYFLREIVSLAYTLHAGPRINEQHDLKIDFPGTIITPKYIPGSVVDVSDVTFCLHGIAHTRTMRNLLHEKFSEAPEGVAIVTEPGLYRLYKGVNGFRQTRRSEFQFVPDEIAHLMARGSLSFFISGDPIRLRFLQKQLRHLIDDRTVTLGNVPISLEGLRLPNELERGFIPYIFSDMNDDAHCGAAVTMLRSLAEYCFLVEIAKYTGAKEVHGIYGMFHEPDIALFMRHPDIAAFSIQNASPNGYISAIAYEKDEVHIEALVDVVKKTGNKLLINFMLGYGSALLDRYADYTDQPLSIGLTLASIGLFGYALVSSMNVVRKLSKHVNRLT